MDMGISNTENCKVINRSESEENRSVDSAYESNRCEGNCGWKKKLLNTNIC